MLKGVGVMGGEGGVIGEGVGKGVGVVGTGRRVGMVVGMWRGMVMVWVMWELREMWKELVLG
ncbi:hypothetical protein, partial [Pseudomonas aeruginosa]|uniref:hypothetical protein n=1 Tax=Pseudomonas aeruginosa TaxID=287 RepID=UPI0024BE94A4